jgi:hypothetical protein
MRTPSIPLRARIGVDVSALLVPERCSALRAAARSHVFLYYWAPRDGCHVDTTAPVDDRPCGAEAVFNSHF